MVHITIILIYSPLYGTLACVVNWLYRWSMKTVNSRLRVLIAERELRDSRSLSIRTITAESGASRSTVERLLSNTIKRVPLDDLGALCSYLDCEVGEILRADEVAEGVLSNS